MFAGYRRIWNNAVAFRHPSLWTFIRCIKDLQSAIENYSWNRPIMMLWTICFCLNKISENKNALKV